MEMSLRQHDANKYHRLALDSGADRAQLIDVKHVIVAEWVRMKCRYGCDEYGVGRLCPPRTPSVEDMRKVLDHYTKGLLFTFDNVQKQGRYKKVKNHRELVYRLERRMFLDGYYRAFGMGCGPCRLCDGCDVEEPCAFPEKARPSMEACGIDVYGTMANVGWELRVVQQRNDPYAMVGLVLIE
jgi:predicted metal-binding protein